MGKEKKSKKRHRHHHQPPSSSTTSASPTAGHAKDYDLASTLSWGLLNFPQLLRELPSIITSIDSGEFVNIDKISHVGYRSLLNKLMVLLPLQHEVGCGWYKGQGVVSISGFILMELLSKQAIVQPTMLTAAQQQVGR